MRALLVALALVPAPPRAPRPAPRARASDSDFSDGACGSGAFEPHPTTVTAEPVDVPSAS